jgi:hypothetical protein
MDVAAALLAACAVAHVLATRLSWAGVPLQTDTGMWAYIGGRILDGAVPYRDLWESKPPGIYYTFAAIEWLFGRGTDSAFLWLDAALSLGVFAATWAVTRCFASRVASAAALLLLSLMFCHRVLADWGDNVEKFVALFEMTACYLVLRSFDSRHARLCWLTVGICCGLAGLFKQTGILFLVATSLTTLWLGVRTRQTAKIILGRIGLMIVGAALLWLPVTAGLLAAGAFHRFWQQVVLFDLLRVGSGVAERSRLTDPEHWSAVLATLKLVSILFGPALLGAALVLLRRQPTAPPARPPAPVTDDRVMFVLVYWLLATAVFPFAPYGYGHYLLQAAPPAAVLAARVFTQTPDGPSRRGWTVAAILVILLGLWPLADHLAFTFDLNNKYRAVYDQMRRETDDLVAIVRQQTAPGESVMLWPPDYAASYYAQRRTPLEASNSDVIFKNKIGRLSPPMPELFARLVKSPPDVILDTMTVGVQLPSPGKGENDVTLVAPQGSFPMAVMPDEDHATPEDRLLAPIKTWVHQSYGGQQYVGIGTIYYRGRPWRPWKDVFVPVK